ncbi:MAG: chromosome segregation protein SMC [Lautropia sp.]
MIEPVRLKQVKLSGFKSFCDPTTFELPGQLVGVVGPNGCGKSNIIDATRWVLGESRATELRGESMQDVIFNGAAERKPAQRASVELVFDNALGRVAGAWSGYAEISVKRVLTRDGQSTYMINNQVVRRKDVHDIFLGTGLGPRAYAIIGQGTISRLIEAKPEELRVFLEEAAGVSKYKERRRETESRLADTRENLTRVEDILRELNAQIERLEQQAEVAGRFRSLEQERNSKQQQLWFIRRRDARAEQEKVLAESSRLALEIEGLATALTTAQTRIVQAREAMTAASDEVDRRQARFYEVNSRISALETQIRFVAQARERIDARLVELAGRIAHAQSLSGAGTDQLDTLLAEGEHARTRAAQAEAAVEELRARRDDAGVVHEAAREALQEAQRRHAEAQQQRHQSSARHQALGETLSDLRRRRERLAGELDTLQDVPADRLEHLRHALEAARADEARLGREQESLEAAAATAEAARAPARTTLQAALEKASAIDARISVLESLQQRMHSEEKVKPWLSRHGIGSDVERVWQRIKIEPGWEIAVEAALRERVHSLEVAHPDALAGMLRDQPPGKLGLFVHSEQRIPDATPSGPLVPLARMVRCADRSLAALIDEWLNGCFAADTIEQAFATRADLPRGGRFLVKAGHAIGRHDVSLFALDADDDGVLARQQELFNLQREQRAQKLLADEARLQSEHADRDATALQARLRQVREAHAHALRHASSATVDFERLSQTAAQRSAARDRLQAEIAEVSRQHEQAVEANEALEARLDELDDTVGQALEASEAAADTHADAERELAAVREALQGAELALQQANFEVRSGDQQVEALKARIVQADESLRQSLAEQTTLAAEQATLDDTAVKAELEHVLDERRSAEARLAEARSHADELAAELRALEERRLGLERDQQPLRGRIGELQLKEQAARLAAEQMDQSLADVQADDEAVQAAIAETALGLGSAPRPSWLQAELVRLAQAIAAIGPVNLAALDELGSASERKAFLDTQSSDLAEAMATLENAIRTIDQESRAVLKETYDAVNRQFGTLFPMLFGGGEARLVLTGEEILDAGIQVVAQPPGKKNASIHLLSGGEKALTAIALVFAIFKLNPAPFCLLDEVDAPLDDANTERYCEMVRSMSGETQFVFISHNKIAMEMAEQLIGVTMQERGVSRLVAVDLTSAAELAQAA